MEESFFADIVVNKDKLSDGNPVFVAHCTNLGIASQGDTTDEALKNIKEAIELYLEEQPKKYDELNTAKEPSIFSFIEISKNAKTSSIVR